MENALTSYTENQASFGYGAGIFYKETGEAKYKFLVASETVPFMEGEQETAEFNLVNSGTYGQVAGKTRAEQKSVELLYTRDNTMIFEKLKDRVLDILCLTPQKVGYKSKCTVKFRPNDAGSDIHRGRYTLTPMSIDPTPYYKAREWIKTPIFFADVIPEQISIKDLGASATGVKINVGLTGGYEGAKYSYDTVVSSTNKVTGTPKEVTADKGVIELPLTPDLYVIYVEPKDGDKENYSGWFTTVYVVE